MNTDDHGPPSSWWPALGRLAVGIVTLPVVFGVLAFSGVVATGRALLQAAARKRPSSEKRGGPPAEED